MVRVIGGGPFRPEVATPTSWQARRVGEDEGEGPACVPEDEVCDGRDNDCDGEVDGVAAGVVCDTGELGECAA